MAGTRLGDRTPRPTLGKVDQASDLAVWNLNRSEGETFTVASDATGLLLTVAEEGPANYLREVPCFQNVAGLDDDDVFGFVDAHSHISAYEFIGGPGEGWFRIVTDPAQARAVIGEGKMAVILGVEASKVLYAGNILETGHTIEFETCAHDHGDDAPPVSSLPDPLAPLGIIDQLLFQLDYVGDRFPATPEQLAEYDPRRGTDHISRKAAEQILELTGRRGYPVINSHGSWGGTEALRDRVASQGGAPATTNSACTRAGAWPTTASTRIRSPT